jgi:proline iminopeptidase
LGAKRQPRRRARAVPARRAGGWFGTVHRRFFDPQFYRIVVFDQRGCGRSMPLGEIHDNTTSHLVADMEKRAITPYAVAAVRRFVGSTLALAYGLEISRARDGLHPARHLLGARSEIDWFLHGMRAIFPRPGAISSSICRTASAAIWATTIAASSTAIPTANVRRRAPGAATSRLLDALPDGPRNLRIDHGGFALALSRIEAHYFAHGTFLPEGWPERPRPHPPPAWHDRAGPLRHRLPARDG